MQEQSAGLQPLSSKYRPCSQRAPNRKSKPFPPTQVSFLTACRSTVSDVTRGRVITRLVSFFEPVEDLVSENDRRRALEVPEDEEELEAPAEHSLE